MRAGVRAGAHGDMRRPAEGDASEVRCPVERECGACQWVSRPYESQLEEKQHRMAQLFDEFGEGFEMLPILGMGDPFHYRNKVMSPFAPGKKNVKTGRREILTGMYAAGTHRLINEL